MQFVPAKEALLAISDQYFRGFDQNYPDFYRFKEWEREFDAYVAGNNLPNLQFVRFRMITSATSPRPSTASRPPTRKCRTMTTSSAPGTNQAFARARQTPQYWQAVMQGQNFAVEDALDTERFNRALWHGLMGHIDYPTPIRVALR